MKLMTIDEWTAENFTPKSRPSDFTVRRWLREDKIAGIKIGKEWFVDQHAWLSGGDDLVERVLSGRAANS